MLKNLTKVKTEHTITLAGGSSSIDPPTVTCSCGWDFGPCWTLTNLRRRAKNHTMDTGHKLRIINEG